MSSGYIYTKKLGGLDVKIWMTIAIAIFLSCILFGFKLFKPMPVSKAPIVITVVNQSSEYDNLPTFQQNETIYLKATGSETVTLNWDFGNGQQISGSHEISYTYTLPGLYTVVVNSSDKGQTAKIDIEIKAINTSTELPWTEEDIRQSLSGPNSIHAGDIAIFRSSLDAASYQWQIENHPEYGVSESQSVSFAIITPGTYHISLVLNNQFDKKTIIPFTVIAPTVNVNVPLDNNDLPAPLPTIIVPADKEKEKDTEEIATAKKVKTKTYQQVPDEIMLKFLNKVIEKQMAAKDFEDYLCEGEQTKVKVNDEMMVFGELCSKLQQKKGFVGRVFKGKTNIKTVKQVRQDGCTAILYITL